MAIKVAYFSPLPPARSGIADYSAALLDELKKLVDVEVFASRPLSFNPKNFDVTLYQVGNNVHHDFCYETALDHPGVVVVHEANLHHLIADITIKRGDWDAYMRAVEQEGSPADLAYADRVRRLEVGPDYEGVPMLRQLLSRSKAAIVHSGCVENELRGAGFSGAVARIPHGAWIPDANRSDFRERLGLDETTPLIGIFGFLKPYKRIAESLRAFRRLVRVHPSAKMILVGDPHPELQLDSLIRSLDLGLHVSVLGFRPIEEFVGYLAACDIVLNLRYPTVGENSGTLMRALGLGKAVVVSEVGSFSELPETICLKAPVDASEEDHLFEYLNLLVSRPEVRKELGARAREWVETECTWPKVARRYADFLERIARKGRHARAPRPSLWSPPPSPPAYVWNRNIFFPGRLMHPPKATLKRISLVSKKRSRSRRRAVPTTVFSRWARICKSPRRSKRASVMVKCGAAITVPRARWTSAASSPAMAKSSIARSNSSMPRRTAFPYGDAYFSTVLCCELLEHLTEDPMHMMAEINRILRPGGHLVLTTPNIGSLRAIAGDSGRLSSGILPRLHSPARRGRRA